METRKDLVAARASFCCGKKDGDVKVFCRVTSTVDPNFSVGEIVATLNGKLTKPMTDRSDDNFPSLSFKISRHAFDREIQEIMENDFHSCEFVTANLYKKFEAKFYCKQRNGFYLEKEARTGFFIVVESTNERFRDGDVVQVIDGETISKKTQNQINSLSMTANFDNVVAEPLSKVLLEQKGREKERIKRKIIQYY